MRALRTVFAMAFMAAALSACASDVPPLRDDRTAVIPGNDTADVDPKEARHTVLLEGARITVDHGYQYFTVVSRDVWTPSGTVHAGTDSAIRPGEDVTIKVFHDGEVPPGGNVFDAQRLLTGGAEGSSAPFVFAPAPYSAGTPGASPRAPMPRCTAYGCDW